MTNLPTSTLRRLTLVAALGFVVMLCLLPLASRRVSLPAAESGIIEQIDWPSPRLGDGPFDIESLVPEHRHLRVVVVARLEQPWSMAWLPDGTALVTERPGRLRLIRNGTLVQAPVEGLPDIHSDGASYQGLMDVVVHPRFEDNGFVYLSYHRPVLAETGGSTRLTGETTIARGVWNGTALTGVKDIFRSGAAFTDAVRLAFGSDGMIYVSTSAPGTGPLVIRSQDPNDYAGKTIRLRDDGSVPPDNPFVGRSAYKPGIYTVGHRNGHAMVVNPETGQMWMTEQGPNGGDEINILRPGGNYGWPFVSHGRNYMGPRISDNPSRDEYEDPAVVWIPSIAVTGATFYTGDRFAGWKHNLFVGGLRQGESPRTGQLQRIEFNEDWEEVRREPLLRELKQRIRDVRQGPDGLLYVLTGEDAGAVLRIEPGDAPAPTL